MITIEIHHGSAAPSKRTYPDEQITIGRRKENLLVLQDSEVSGRHALIEKTAEGWVVVDRGSTNGTLVNGEKIGPDIPIALRADTRIGIGPYTITGEFDVAGIGDTLITAPGAHRAGPPPVEQVAEELEALFASRLRAPTAERTNELRAALRERHAALGDATMEQVLEGLVQRFRSPAGGEEVEAAAGQAFYPAGFKVLSTLSRSVLGREDQFAVVEEVERFGDLLGAFVQATCAWIVRCIQVRNDLKETFGSDATRYLSGKRNPVESVSKASDVALTLLDWTDQNRQAKSTADQLDALFKAFVAQQGGLLEGARGVADEVLRHLSPAHIEARAQQTAGLMGAMKMSVAKSSPLWQAYCQAWAGLSEGGRVQNEVVVPIIRQAFARMARGGDEKAES